MKKDLQKKMDEFVETATNICILIKNQGFYFSFSLPAEDCMVGAKTMCFPTTAGGVTLDFETIKDTSHKNNTIILMLKNGLEIKIEKDSKKVLTL